MPEISARGHNQTAVGAPSSIPLFAFITWANKSTSQFSSVCCVISFDQLLFTWQRERRQQAAALRWSGGGKKQRPGRAQPRVQRENSTVDSCIKGDEREARLTPRCKRDQVTVCERPPPPPKCRLDEIEGVSFNLGGLWLSAACRWSAPFFSWTAPRSVSLEELLGHGTLSRRPQEGSEHTAALQLGSAQDWLRGLRPAHICRGMALVLLYDQMGKLGRYLTGPDNLLNCTSGRKFEMTKFAQFLFWPRDLKPSRVTLAFGGQPLNSEYHFRVPHVKVNSILLMNRFSFSALPYLPI